MSSLSLSSSPCSWMQLLAGLSPPLSLILSTLSSLPLYPCCFLLACALLMVEEAVAGSVVVQLAVTVLLGVLLAAIALVLLIYRSLTHLFTHSIS
jgi:hypothetical protein